MTTDDSPDEQPTRDRILMAFEEHLIKQAKPGDVVVFHFSGHGSRLYVPNSLSNCPNPLVSDKRVGLKASRRIRVYNGSISCTLLEYELY